MSNPTPRLTPARGLVIGLILSASLWILSIAGCSAYQAFVAEGLSQQENFSGYRSAATEEAARLRAMSH